MDIATITDIYGKAGGPVLSYLVIGAVLLVALPAAVLIGHHAGRLHRLKTVSSGKGVDLQAGQTSLGGILTLLGLLLAFSFGNALSIAQAGCVATTIQPDAPPAFKSPKHQIHS
ncbi:hypothetical protein [Sedimentitalea todarodis]|uniref:Uncharacterized protein n=1 Tax=Sedimentitalea todarodis TaxID=1631240 RepID=A0ABU3VL02_9RHOB|nr:hypothetical protein [Sedimentitalea todarodis]MDU9006863.1 hypothetical protein [Sedimentitalea todarodis]